MIQKLDPSGKKEVVVEHEGIGFDILEGNLANCKQGEIGDDGDDGDVIPTLT